MCRRTAEVLKQKCSAEAIHLFEQSAFDLGAVDGVAAARAQEHRSLISAITFHLHVRVLEQIDISMTVHMHMLINHTYIITYTMHMQRVRHHDDLQELQ